MAVKKILTIILCIILLCSCIIPSFAFSVYGNVTPSTSQIVILIEAMLNDPVFNTKNYWVAARTGETEYTIYYNIDFNDNFACYYRYYQTGSGYNNVWNLDYGDTYNFSYPLTSYTMVGNLETTLYSELYNNYKFNYYRNFFLIFLFFIVAYFVFRIRKKELSL